MRPLGRTAAFILQSAVLCGSGSFTLPATVFAAETTLIANDPESIGNAVIQGLNTKFQVIADFEDRGGAQGLTMTRDGESLVYYEQRRIVVRSMDDEIAKYACPITPKGKVRVFLHEGEDANHVAVCDEKQVSILGLEKKMEPVQASIEDQTEKFIHWSASSNGHYLAGLTSKLNFYLVKFADGVIEFHGLGKGQTIRQGEAHVNDDGNRLYLFGQPGSILMVKLDAKPGEEKLSNATISETRHIKASSGTETVGYSGQGFLVIHNMKTERTNTRFGDHMPIACKNVVRNGKEAVVSVCDPQMNRLPAVISISFEKALRAQTWFLPDRDPDDICWDSEGRRIAYTESRRIKVLQSPDASFMQGRELLTPVIRKLIDDSSFEVIDAVSEYLQSLDSDVRPRPTGQWFNLLREEIRAFDSREFDEGRDTPSFLVDWIDSDPTSQTARVIAAQWHIDSAWRSRGDEVAARLTEEQSSRFHFHLSKAEELVGKLDAPDTFPELLAVAVDVAKGLGWTDDQKSSLQSSLQRHLKFAPAHHKVVEMLLPRWGGQPGAVKEYVTTVSDKLGGDDGDRMYAYISLHLAVFFSPRNFLESTGLDRERIVRGALLTQPGRDVNMNGYLNFLIWHVVNREMEDASKLIRHYESYEVGYGTPLNEVGAPYTVARMILKTER